MVYQHDEERMDGILGNGDAAVLTGRVSRESTYGNAAWAFRKLVSAVKKTPAMPRKALHLVSGLGKSGKIYRLEVRIERYEKRLRKLFYEIGKAGIAYSGEGNVLETEPVETLLARVQETELKIEKVKHTIWEIKEKKERTSENRRKTRHREDAPASEAVAEEWQEMPDSKDLGALETAIDMAIRFGDFETSSEKEIFQKVANDLLDKDIEVRILAATELGKIGKEVAVPILLEAAGSNNGDLVSEIINSLISLGDKRAVSLFRDRASDPIYRVRLACLRGLYKLADQREDIPVLREALKDVHPEIRRTAATFLGWKDGRETVPALVQCLRDEDRRVRKAAVSALAHLKDEFSVLPLTRVLADKDLEIRQKALQCIKMISGNDDLRFDVYAEGPELDTAIDRLRDWWEKERMQRVYENGTGVEPFETGVTEAESAAANGPIAMGGSEASNVVEIPASEEFSKAASFDEEHLKKMVKADLLTICRDLGIETDENLRKADLIALVLEKTE